MKRPYFLPGNVVLSGCNAWNLTYNRAGRREPGRRVRGLWVLDEAIEFLD